MSDQSADYKPASGTRHFGTIAPSQLIASPESASQLPMKPVVISELTPAGPSNPQAQPAGQNGPTPMFDGTPAKPQGERVVPAPFKPARG